MTALVLAPLLWVMVATPPSADTKSEAKARLQNIDQLIDDWDIDGAKRELSELEKQTRRRFYLQPKEDTHLDHFLVLAEGKREELAPVGPAAEGAKLEVKLVEVGLHDPSAGVAKVDGVDVCVADAARLVGKKVKIELDVQLVAQQSQEQVA